MEEGTLAQHPDSSDSRIKESECEVSQKDDQIVELEGEVSKKKIKSRTWKLMQMILKFKSLC